MRRVHLTRHATDRMAEMDVSRREVEEAVRQPEVTWTTTRTEGNAHAMITAKLGRITVAWFEGRDGEAVVVTVLWNTQDRYERRDG